VISATALKRGGHYQTISIDAAEADERYALEPADPVTPEALYERRWAMTVLETVIASLREEIAQSGSEAFFETLEPHLAGAPSASGYTAAAKKLGMKEATVRVAVFRLRSRYGELLRQYIADTVSSPGGVAAEFEHLMQSLSL
jgi:DNA-binding transcriptional regulator PaaX